MAGAVALCLIGACTSDGPRTGVAPETRPADSATAQDVVDAADGDMDHETELEVTTVTAEVWNTDTAAEVDTTLPRPRLTLHIRGSTTPFVHDDLLAGQTPTMAAGGIRSLSLLVGADDPTPAVVFANGQAPVEASYEDNADTVITSVDVAGIPSGHYTLARLEQAYSRFEIAATLHDGLATTPGTLSCLAVLGNDTLVDGALRDAGFYQATFASANALPANLEGADFPIPTLSSTAGAVGVVEDGQWAVYFPIDLQWNAAATQDLTLTITVNMFESFRWADLLVLGYLPGVFDMTRLAYEPVLRFGGNAFTVSLE